MNVRRHSVFLQQPILAPYRLAFFRRLAQSPVISPTVVYGQEAPSSALRSVRDPEGISAICLRNVFIPSERFMTAQVGALTAFDVTHFDTLICSFDPRTITNALLMMKARRHGVPIILWGHGVRPRRRYRDIYRRAAEMADAVILYSGYGKQQLVELGVDKDKMFVAWNSIDTQSIATLREPTPLADRNGIIYLGRLVAEKKIWILLEAFARAKPALPAGAHLYVVGSGPMAEPAAQLAQRLGIQDAITFVRETYDEKEISRWMNRCWISVSPGYLGLSVIHAFAYGMPILAGDHEPHSPEVEAVRAGENGEFFPSNSPTALAERLVALRSDHARLGLMGQHAARSSESFSVASMVRAFERAVAFAHREGPPETEVEPARTSAA